MTEAPKLPSIYGLYDRSGELRYIGKANNPAARLNGHMRETRRRRTPLYDWLQKHGRPTIQILEAECLDWREAERRHIAQARARGEQLLNLADGGDEPLCPPDVRRANGHALSKSLKSDPKAKKLQEIKRAVANGLRYGHLSEANKQKFRDLAEYDPQLFGCWKHI